MIAASGVGGQRVLLAGAAAVQAGVRIGQTLTEASAVVPGLLVFSHDPVGDRRALAALASWADAFSPIVHLEGEDTLILDVTGCARLFGGEDRLLERAFRAAQAQGYTVRAALADTLGAAWAIAHEGEAECVLVAPGQTAAALARLPVRALRIDPDVAERLQLVGVEMIEALLHLPRSAVATRFGEGLLRRLDQALGAAPELLTPYVPPVLVRAALRLPVPSEKREVLEASLGKTVEEFATKLRRQAAGTRQVQVTFYFPREPHETIGINLARPSRDAGHFERLLRVRLEQYVPPEGFEALVVWTRQVENLDGLQRTWFDVADGTDDLADLWDRLGARLGNAAVVRVRTVDEHLPEAAYAYVPLAEAEADREKHNSRTRPGVRKKPAPSGATADALPASGDGGGAASCRPVRLLARPVPVPVMAMVPDGPPLRFRFHGRDHRVSRWAGPERIETGWWRGSPAGRDYFRVESDNGCHYWLFRDQRTARWFAQGVFD